MEKAPNIFGIWECVFGVQVFGTWCFLLPVCILDRVVGTSKFQTAQPDALFVCFLGMGL